MDSYSVSQAIDSFGVGPFQWLLAVAVGFAWVADAMEMMILSILSPALHCEWHISKYQQANLTTVVFLGMMLSSPLFGTFADMYGRRLCLIVSSSFLLYFGFLTSFAPNFTWVLILRFLVGVFIGSVPQAATLFAEYLPTRIRGRAIMGMCLFWALGAIFEAFLAWLVMPTLGWRYLIGISCIPLLIFVLMSPMLPESVMYHAVMGEKDLVQQQLNKVARWNRKPTLVGALHLENESNEKRGRLLDLFDPGTRTMAFMTLFLWFFGAFSYYGVVLFTTELLNDNAEVCMASGQASIDGLPGHQDDCSVSVCRGLTESNYIEIITTTVAEFPGLILAMLLIDWIGRRKTMALLAFIFTVSTFLVIECSFSKTLLIVILFVSRGSAVAFLQSVYVYTPEVYPTRLRAVAMGTGSSMARFGAMITPYVAQVLLRTSLYAAVSVYAVLGLISTVVAWKLPVETKGMDLNEASWSANKGRIRFVNEETSPAEESSPAAEESSPEEAKRY